MFVFVFFIIYLRNKFKIKNEVSMFRKLLMVLLIISSLCAVAQNEFFIDKDNFKIVPRTDSLARLSPNALQSVEKPLYGENQKWDYSNLDTSDLIIKKLISEITTYPTMKGLFVYHDFFEVLAFNRGYYYDEFYKVDEEGYKNMVWGFPYSQKINIGDLTGNELDNIFIPYQFYPFDNPRFIIKFPSKYATSITSNFVKSLFFKLNIFSLKIYDNLAHKVSHIEQTDSVVGWGSLKVPNLKETNGVSKDYDVVLIQRTTARIDSFFLQEKPASIELLKAFGVEQGAKSTSHSLIFWRANKQSPLLTINYDSSFTKPNDVIFDIDVAKELSIEETNLNNGIVSVYPNPLQLDSQIIISDNFTSSGSILVSDIFGNVTEKFSITEIKSSIKLNNNYPNGIYFVSLYDLNNKLLSQTKIIVAQ